MHTSLTPWLTLITSLLLLSGCIYSEDATNANTNTNTSINTSTNTSTSPQDMGSPEDLGTQADMTSPLPDMPPVCPQETIACALDSCSFIANPEAPCPTLVCGCPQSETCEPLSGKCVSAGSIDCKLLEEELKQTCTTPSHAQCESIQTLLGCPAATCDQEQPAGVQCHSRKFMRPPNASSSFGHQVEIWNRWAFVSDPLAPDASGTASRGAVYVYRFNENEKQWFYDRQLTVDQSPYASENGSGQLRFFGAQLAIYKDVLYVASASEFEGETSRFAGVAAFNLSQSEITPGKKIPLITNNNTKPQIRNAASHIVLRNNKLIVSTKENQAPRPQVNTLYTYGILIYDITRNGLTPLEDSMPDVRCILEDPGTLKNLDLFSVGKGTSFVALSSGGRAKVCALSMDAKNHTLAEEVNLAQFNVESTLAFGQNLLLVSSPNELVVYSVANGMKLKDLLPAYTIEFAREMPSTASVTLKRAGEGDQGMFARLVEGGLNKRRLVFYPENLLKEALKDTELRSRIMNPNGLNLLGIWSSSTQNPNQSWGHDFAFDVQGDQSDVKVRVIASDLEGSMIHGELSVIIPESL